MKWRYGAVTTDLSSVLRPPSSVLCPHPRMGITLNLRRLRGLATAVALLVLAVVAPVAQAQRSGSVQRDVSVERNRGIVALVGAGLGSSSRAMSRALGSLADTRVHMLSLSASGINLTMLIDGDRVAGAMRALHEEFFGSDKE